MWLSMRLTSAEEVGARLAAVVESSADAIIGTNLAGVIESWNPAATRLFGYSAVEAIGNHRSMLVPPGRSHEDALILERIARGDRIVPFETVKMRKDGSLVEVSLAISPILNGQGQMASAVEITRDISERVQLQQSIEQAQLATEEVARMRSDFVTAINHELRTPLTAIIGFTDLLMARWETLSEPRKREHLARIRAAAERQRQMVEDLLLLPHLDSETPQPFCYSPSGKEVEKS